MGDDPLSSPALKAELVFFQGYYGAFANKTVRVSFPLSPTRMIELLGALLPTPSRETRSHREALRALGCERLHTERVSSIAVREALREALAFCREGDTLLVTKLDRLARSVRHLGDIVEDLERRKVVLKVLALGLDTGTATGKLMLKVLGSVAQFDREMMLERQKEGIAKAKHEGKYLGRKPTGPNMIA